MPTHGDLALTTLTRPVTSAKSEPSAAEPAEAHAALALVAQPPAATSDPLG
jgi:hypothetical protein